jgi:hypothetical protein
MLTKLKVTLTQISKKKTNSTAEYDCCKLNKIKKLKKQLKKKLKNKQQNQNNLNIVVNCKTGLKTATVVVDI